jgi:hypothetical protein
MDATVQLMLYRACQLPSTERLSKIDPYIKVVSGTQTVKSTVVQDNDNPEVRARPAPRSPPARSRPVMHCIQAGQVQLLVGAVEGPGLLRRRRPQERRRRPDATDSVHSVFP